MKSFVLDWQIQILKYFLKLFSSVTELRDQYHPRAKGGGFLPVSSNIFSFTRHCKDPYFLQKKKDESESLVLKVHSGFVAVTAATRRGGAQ